MEVKRDILNACCVGTADLYVYVQLCFGMSSVKQFLQMEVSQFYLEQFYIKIFKTALMDSMLSLGNTQA